MKVILFFFLLTSCSGHQEDPTDDYVLIEFASKLEEEYHKLEPQKKR